ncbi:unnamed protein product, partial [Ilex paraguariensis]
MADIKVKNSDNRRQSIRLQRRAPASIQINRPSDWNVAIPLLSPLVTSPSAPQSKKLTAEIRRPDDNQSTEAAKEKAVVFKKWQHPAAPFCYEPAPLVA